MTTLKLRIQQIWFADMRPLLWPLSAGALLLGFGFFIGDVDNPNYILITKTLYPFLWGLLFSVYGSVLLIQSLYRTNTVITSITYIIGIWLWSYIFFSFAIFDPSEPAATEWLLLLPLLTQLWVFFNLICKIPDYRNTLSNVFNDINVDIKLLNNTLTEIINEHNSIKEEFFRLSSEVEHLQKFINTKIK